MEFHLLSVDCYSGGHIWGHALDGLKRMLQTYTQEPAQENTKAKKWQTFTLKPSQELPRFPAESFANLMHRTLTGQSRCSFNPLGVCKYQSHILNFSLSTPQLIDSVTPSDAGPLTVPAEKILAGLKCRLTVSRAVRAWATYLNIHPPPG